LKISKAESVTTSPLLFVVVAAPVCSGKITPPISQSHLPPSPVYRMGSPAPQEDSKKDFQ
jgi:hypothetical protein